MNEDFVTYEIALKLKEKGFGEKCLYRYRNYSKTLHPNRVETKFARKIDYSEFFKCYNSYEDNDIDAPTIPQVLKWLRKKYFIHISTKPYPCEDGTMWLYEIRKFNEYKSVVVANKTGFIKEEQAAIAGIEYVLDNLI